MAAVVVLALVAGTMLYAMSVRPKGDANLGGISIDALQVINDAARGAFPDAAAQDLSFALGDNSERVDIFLISDSGSRLPALRDHMESSLLMFTVANQVWIASDDGDHMPAVASIAGAQQALAGSADLRRLSSVDASGTERLDNADMKVVSVLLDLAESELQQAKSYVVRR